MPCRRVVVDKDGRVTGADCVSILSAEKRKGKKKTVEDQSARLE